MRKHQQLVIVQRATKARQDIEDRESALAIAQQRDPRRNSYRPDQTWMQPLIEDPETDR